jgi:hypothetical protein
MPIIGESGPCFCATGRRHESCTDRREERAMDTSKHRLLEQSLAEAERHVTEGERLLEQQRNNIEERRRDGHDVRLSIELLSEMEETQRMHIAGRDRLRNELASKAR